MDVLPFLVPLVIGGAALVVGAWLGHWRWTRRLGLQASSSPHSGAVTHRWRVASREEARGSARVVYRCEECGALEVREQA